MYAVSVDNHADHDFACGFRLPEEQVAQASFPGRFVVNAVTRPTLPFPKGFRRGCKFRGLQQTFSAVYNPVAVCGIKAQTDFSIRSDADGELCLVAVMIRLFGPRNWIQQSEVKAADALHGILYFLPFGTKFRFIRNMPVYTPSAACEQRAVRRNAVFRRRKYFFYFSISAVFCNPSDFHFQPVAGCGEGNKNGNALVSSHAAALRAVSRDFQLNSLVFSQFHIGTSAGLSFFVLSVPL